MITSTYRRIVLGQFEASLAMLEECIRNCPPKKWEGIIGKYPFWQVAYHALYCTDLYTARNEGSWRLHDTFHPGGMADVEGEYPTRMFTKRELLAYLEYVSKRVRASMRRETEASLRGPSGFSWLKMPRAEVPIYSMRHVQHHAGQLGAYLRRAKVKTRWVKSGAK